MTLLRDEHEAGRTRQRGILHDLRATPKTVHWGYFDASLAPVLKVASGDLDPGRGDHPSCRRRPRTDDG